jgi:hypothetical protein|nr:hypothetical protein [Neorhizobium tomejilense]
MTDMIAKRDVVLENLVSLRKRYFDLATRQSERLDAIRIETIPTAGFVGSERAVMAEESSMIEDFAKLVGEFPEFEPMPGFVVTKVEEKSRWFRIRKTHEVLKEAEPPEMPEARLQNARLLHLLETFGEDLSNRRVALQHASYTLKRAVVGLNQAASFSCDSEGARSIERDRHGLESLVSLIDRVILDIVVAARRIESLAAARAAAAAPENAYGTEDSASLMLAG